MFALIPYAVTPEPRTDSKPFRRRFVRKTGFGSCRRKFLQNYFRQSFESSPGVQRVATLDLLETWSPCSRPFAILPVSAVSDAQKLATGNFLHVRACFLVTFCTTQKVTSRSLCREHRGFPNLDSARRSCGFAQTKLKPYPKGASRFCKPRISTQNNNFAQTKLKPFSALRQCPCRDSTLRVLFAADSLLAQLFDAKS